MCVTQPDFKKDFYGPFGVSPASVSGAMKPEYHEAMPLLLHTAMLAVNFKYINI